MLYLELAIVTVLIVINGLLSMSELGDRLVAAGEARGAGRERRQRLAAARWRWPSDPGKFLSTVQIGITLIGVLSGAFSGATLGQRLTHWLLELGLSPSTRRHHRRRPRRRRHHLCFADRRRTRAEADRAARSRSDRREGRAGDGLMAKFSLPLVWLLDRSGKVLLWLLGHRGEAEGQGQRG